MSDPRTARRADYILRALAASEIAESAPTVELRRSFLDLAAQWLFAAEQSRDPRGAPDLRAAQDERGL